MAVPSGLEAMREKLWADTFLIHVVKDTPGGYTTPCWKWTGALSWDGYGRFKARYAHVCNYEHDRGYRLKKGVLLDHLCRNRWCVRVDHLEEVDNRENVLRGEAPSIKGWRDNTCMRGHPKNEENMYMRKDRAGKWNCRECQKEDRRRRREQEG